ncbi:HAD family phosphatase [Sphingobacterium alkalisoli]|uniref:HAD family phosphatase n=1 Tax=Sphingobacterium alkalisoli TaxID=1874115 RepID=A0A4U0H213_9SPHI|nr:HAD family phosphatase [Sphingobacterium alkalisoli]TJY65625.1 HAD family phosphatase [Sphingobacterium alkalisoli]GGH19345.1 carotenoid dehydrogenase [Sphingobacterium alkalisoli]
MTEAELTKYNTLKKIVEPFETLLFDIDGTLADNMHAHKASYVATALEYGVTLDPNLIDETAGWPTTAVAKEIAIRYGVDFDYDVFAKRKSAIFIAKYVSETKPIEFVRQVLLDFEHTKKIGLVSGGTRSTLAITLATIDVAGRYETLVCAGDTTLGKPSHEPFTLAAKNLNVAAEQCIVLEDGEPGVQGAIAAGMSWVRIDQI